MSAAVTHEANRSYRDVLRNRHVAGLLLGDLLANVGTGMIIVAMPVQTLSIHGNVPKAIAIGLVEAAPFVLSTILALSPAARRPGNRAGTSCDAVRSLRGCWWSRSSSASSTCRSR